MMSPDAGKEIGLELEPHREAVVFRFTDAATLRLHLVADTEEILHVMSDFVRDNVSLREVSGRAEAFVERSIESKVDVNAPILRAVERSTGAAGESASGPGLVREEHELRLFILAAHLPEELMPGVLGVGEDNANKLRRFVARRIALDLPGWRHLRLLLRIDQGRGIAAEEKVSDDQNDPTDSAANRDASAPRATHVFNVVAFTSSLPKHRFIEFGLLWQSGCLGEGRSPAAANSLQATTPATTGEENRHSGQRLPAQRFSRMKANGIRHRMNTTSELRLAKRMARLGTETAFEVLVKARALEAKGRDIVHLEIGEPDFDTPANIIGAATDALHKGFTHYGPSAGLPPLRETIAQYVSEKRRINATPDEVVVVPGGKPIIFFTILALAEEGDEVIYPNPGFPIYESMIDYVGAKAVPIQLREEMDFRLDVDELGALINDRTKLIILNSPHNPTGGVLTKEDIDGVARAIGDRNVMVLTDEIYSRLIFEGEHHSIMSVEGMKDRCILLDGFSKTYAMTGWRMGYGVMRADFATHIARLMTNSNSCTASFTQVAGIEALRGPQGSVETMCAEFQKRRDVMVAGLNKIKGFSCLLPKGAFYVFPNIKETGWPSKKLADALLEEAGVAGLSGTAFGEFGEGYLRFSVANSIENIEKALERVGSWVQKNL